MIPDGEVDERSITDVRPKDLDGFVQCHFFAGIGGWSAALNIAKSEIHKNLWTGSCPCQPFSTAGKRNGVNDERHLWPDFFRLIAARKPEIVFGEQVASSEVVGTQLETAFIVAVQAGEFARANKLANKLVKTKGFHYQPRWVDRVRADMEAEGYSFEFHVLGAHSVGAPHIRQRLWWVGYTKDGNREIPERESRKNSQLRRPSGFGGMVNLFKPGLAGYAGDGYDRGEPGRNDSETAGSVTAPIWNGSAVWWPCRDGKLRRIPGREIEPEIQRVVDGVSPGLDGCGLVCDEKIFPLTTETEGRAHLLRGYGNAIVPQVAAEFVGAVIESIDDLK
jgi:DNA (cytosine-5)-methyltransferase 1